VVILLAIFGAICFFVSNRPLTEGSSASSHVTLPATTTTTPEASAATQRILSVGKTQVKQVAQSADVEHVVGAKPVYHYPPSWIGSDHQKTRREDLADVFALLDIDNSGTVDASELSRVASKRRQLGHKGGEWTAEKNDKLFTKLDRDKNGTVDPREFSTHYEMVLPRKPESFVEIIQEFERAATAVRQESASL